MVEWISENEDMCVCARVCVWYVKVIKENSENSYRKTMMGLF